MAVDVDSILQNFGGICVNDLIHLMGNDADSDNDISTLKYSAYISVDEIVQCLQDKQGKFSIFSLNT